MIEPVPMRVVNDGPNPRHAVASADAVQRAFDVLIAKTNEVIASTNDIAVRLERLEALMPHAPGIED